MIRKKPLPVLSSLFFAFLFGQSIAQSTDQLSGLEYRNIGPHRGGRVTAVTGVPGELFTFFMGTTGGGVWKTTDGGLNWQNISDGFFNVGSIGAVEVAPSDPNVVYAGTGSGCPRGNISPGDGIYKSTDGGRTWKHVGLEQSGAIARMAIDPADPDRVYAAVLGNPFGPSEERGVFRTKDGGATWEKVLYISDRTGAADLVLQPGNARVIYAGMWTAERKPWTLIDGSEEGGVWKSTDGGDSWKKLENGLPTGLVGRVGIAVSPVNPNRVWVIQEAKEETMGGLFVSDNGGKSFERINRDHRLRQRAWYYNHVFADPKNEHTVYVLNTGFLKSIDGGKSFDRIGVPHGDNHALWINPEHPDIMVEGNDGGACVTFNGGQSWTTQNNQPTSEFYRVTTDHQWPYRVYGAQQDNSTISVASRSSGGLTPYQDWYQVGGGESGHIAVDPRDPNLIYAGNYIGQITRSDRNLGHSKDVVAYPQMHDGQAPRDIVYRFQWNAPIRISPHDPDIVYHCSQYVHRTRDGGQNWEVISPDLTTNKDEYHNIPGGPIQHDHTGVELYTTIFAFEESPHKAGELWTGSDDGRLHLSVDDGNNWKEITPPGMPMEGTVNSIDLSLHTPGKATIAVYRYRENDFKPYIFQTADYGKTWESLTDGNNGIPGDHFVRVVREDPEREGLLYAGTEFGMYLSFDNGRHWESFQLNLPKTPVTDLQVKENDLVLATQGRSFWILDNLCSLRSWPEVAGKEKAYLFRPAAAYRTQLRNPRGTGAPDPAPNGAVIDFFLESLPDSGIEVRLSILDGKGVERRVFSTNPSSKNDEEQLVLKPGLNRLVWNLRYQAPKVQPQAVFSLANTGGVRAPTGPHSIRLSVGDQHFYQLFQVKKDPRWQQSDADLQAQYQLAWEVKGLLEECHRMIGQIRSIRQQIDGLISHLAERPEGSKGIEEKANSLTKQLTALEEELIQVKSESGQDPINYPSMLDDQIAYLYSVVNSMDDRPTQGAYQRLEDLRESLAGYSELFAKYRDEEVKSFNDFLKQEGIEVIMVH